MRTGALTGALDEPAVVEYRAEYLGAKGGLKPARSLLFEDSKEVLAHGGLEGVTKRIDLVSVEGR